MKEALETLSVIVPPLLLSERAQEAFGALSASLAQDFVRCVYRELKNNPASIDIVSALCERAFASDAPLASWVGEIVKTSRWLEREGRSARLVDMIDYVSCAVEGSALQNGHSVEWYLSTYGFERSVPLASPRLVGES
jgi:hypothetical protein